MRAHSTKLTTVASTLLASLALTATAQAGQSVRIAAPRVTPSAARIHYVAEVNGARGRVAFLVDGKRHWHNRSGGHRFRRSGVLRASRLGRGRHVLVVKVARRRGRPIRAKRVVLVSARSGGKRRGRPPKEEQTPEPELASESNPEDETTAQPELESQPTSKPESIIEEEAATEAETPAAGETEPPVESAPLPLLEAGFENGLVGWSTAGVGEATPTSVSDIVRSGAGSGRVTLSGSQDRSELILGGNGTGSTSGVQRFSEGAEYWYGFSFYIVSMVYGHPGAHNLIMQFKGNDGGSPAFGLQLWDYEGDDGEYKSSPKGLWSHGIGMGGDRFLAPAAEQQWHDVVLRFKVSRVGDGFYEVFLDGRLVDARSNTSILVPEATYGYIKNGIYRNGAKIPGTSEIRLDGAGLGTSYAAVAAS